ncbi:T-cell surface antigen CD2 [Heterocephalus glaber]|uniref:T-cell surface antigen CD2 n=1 Tax=Heterocephalus glaber TaxID=10181 RepID=G5BFJ5_HETGA|nr:T-cell surface antigen CD2 [Heterocephalus glaber]
MSLPYKSLASFFLLFSFSTKGSVLKEHKVIWGALDQDINLDIPNFQMSNLINEIRWETNGIKVAQLKGKKQYELNKTYEILPNGTLKIKHLGRSFNNIYKIIIYDTNGTSVLDKEFRLNIQEMVSKPEISWNCSNKTLTCEVVNGTNPNLNLYQNGKYLKKGSKKVITYQWTKLTAAFNCTANNKVSEESSAVAISCPGKGLNFYLMVGICGGSALLVVFVALLICYICKRKKQNGRRCDEGLEISTRRITTEEGGLKPCHIQAPPAQKTSASHPPPPPSHRSQAPGHRPLAPAHHVQPQHQKRPPPSGTQVRQQKGPPLPKPRVQPKPPRGAAEHSLSPATN